MTLDIVLSVVLIFSAVCYVLLALRLLGGKREIASLPLGATFIVIGLWVLGGAVELMSTTLAAFTVGRVGHFVGTALVPVSLLICFREYIGSHTSKFRVVALLLIPVLSIIVAASNSWHELMWVYPAINAAGEFLTRPDQWGPWFLYVHAPYGYVAVTASILTLLIHSSAVAPAHRRGLFLLAGAAIPPVIAAVVYDFGIGPNTISILPLAFALMLPVYAWLLIGEQIIGFSPIAYETVFQNMQDPVIVLDEQERVVGLNRGAELLLNITEKDAMRKSLGTVFGEDVPEVYAALGTGRPQKMMTNTGRFLHLQVTPIATNEGTVQVGRVLMFRDVSDVEKAQREVQNSERLLRTLIDHSVNGVIRLRWISADGSHDHRELRCIFANAAAGRFLQIDTDELIDKTAAEVAKLYSVGMETTDAESLLEHFLETAQNGDVFDSEVSVGSGRRARWLRVISEPVGEDVAVTFVDITDRKVKEAQMQTIAQSDPLTGVLNRRGFEDEASRRLSDSADDATGALLFIDLNDFKLINDRCGHEVGDALLTIAADRLKSSLRPGDIIGRPGGDEFVALVPDVSGTVAQKLAERLTQSLEKPYLIGKEELDCAAAIGLALYPQHANTLTGLLRAADQAMYRAKARCRGVAVIDRTDLLEKAG
jgi:diguanylate cyclase (GGDEF)-like protein